MLLRYIYFLRIPLSCKYVDYVRRKNGNKTIMWGWWIVSVHWKEDELDEKWLNLALHRLHWDGHTGTLSSLLISHLGLNKGASSASTSDPQWHTWSAFLPLFLPIPLLQWKRGGVWGESPALHGPVSLMIGIKCQSACCPKSPFSYSILHFKRTEKENLKCSHHLIFQVMNILTMSLIWAFHNA